MKVKDQICSFEQANEIAGFVKLETLFLYVIHESSDADEYEIILAADLLKYDDMDGYLVIPAPNVAELGILLSDNTHESTCYELCGEKFFDFCVEYNDGDDFINDDFDYETKVFQSNNEARARADSFIFLLENDYLKASELKL